MTTSKIELTPEQRERAKKQMHDQFTPCRNWGHNPGCEAIMNSSLNAVLDAINIVDGPKDHDGAKNCPQCGNSLPEPPTLLEEVAKALHIAWANDQPLVWTQLDQDAAGVIRAMAQAAIDKIKEGAEERLAKVTFMANGYVYKIGEFELLDKLIIDAVLGPPREKTVREVYGGEGSQS